MGPIPTPHPLGQTGLEVSPIALGAGPIPELMTEDEPERQQAVLRRARELGINWIDTAAGYGGGRSEKNLGEALAAIEGLDDFQIATKVRVLPRQLEVRPLRVIVRESVVGSLFRLGVKRISLLQLHNSLTAGREDEPTSLTPEDVLGPAGVLAVMRELQDDGVVEHFGLTGIGQPAALREVIASGSFQAIQVPFHLLNPTAAYPAPPDWNETDYGQIIGDCRAQQMGVFAIRVYAGGALLGRPPARHTLTTPFFPLGLYERDAARAAALADRLPAELSLAAAAVRFAIGHPSVNSAIIGFSEPGHVDEAVTAFEQGPLEEDLAGLLTA